MLSIPGFPAGGLLIKPDRRQILIEEMARTDLPALHIRAVRHDPVPPQRRDVMYLIIERVLFEGPIHSPRRPGSGPFHIFLLKTIAARSSKFSLLPVKTQGGW